MEIPDSLGRPVIRPKVMHGPKLPDFSDGIVADTIMLQWLQANEVRAVADIGTKRRQKVEIGRAAAQLFVSRVITAEEMTRGVEEITRREIFTQIDNMHTSVETTGHRPKDSRERQFKD